MGLRFDGSFLAFSHALQSYGFLCKLNITYSSNAQKYRTKIKFFYHPVLVENNRFNNAKRDARLNLE